MEKKFSFIIAVICVLSLSILAGCGSMKLSENYNKDDVETNAKQVVADLVDGNYDTVYKQFTSKITDSMDVNKFQSSIENLNGNIGAYKQIKSVSIIGQKDKSTNEDDAVALVVTEYEKKTITYVVSYNPSMQLSGLHIK